MNKKLKEMTPEEMAEYRHKVYLKHRSQRLEYSRNYYKKNKEQIKIKQLISTKKN